MELLNFLFGETREEKRPADDDDFWYRKLNYNVNGAVVSEQGAMSITAVYSSVRVLAEGVSSLPLITYRRLPGGGKERAREHRLFKLLAQRPNKWQTKMEFWEMLIGHVALRGNAFAQKIMSRGGFVVELIPLNPTRMEVKVLSSGELRYYYRLQSGETREFPANEILHIRGLSSDGILGLSPIELMSRPFELAISQDTFANQFYRNYAQVGGILVHPGKLLPEAKMNLKKSWEQAHAGVGNAFRVAVLEEGLKWEAIGVSQKDAQFLESKKFSVTDIARIFRVPPHMIGDLDRATFSNIEQQSSDFVINSLRPWLVRTEEVIQRDLFGEADSEEYFAEWLVDGLLRGDTQTRYGAYVQGLNNGFLNADEVRAYENLNPIPDGSGKVFRVPLNTAPASSEPTSDTEDDADPSPTSPPLDDEKRVSTSHEDDNPVEGGEPIFPKTIFSNLFIETYAREVRREQKRVEQKGAASIVEPEWRSKQEAHLSENLSLLLNQFCLTNGYDKDELRGIILKRDKELSELWLKQENRSDLPSFKVLPMWGIIEKVLSNGKKT